MIHNVLSGPFSSPLVLLVLITDHLLQAVMGSLVKRLLAPLLGCGSDPNRLYHVTVMPCYDKKLEAVREDLTLPGGLPEVSIHIFDPHIIHDHNTPDHFDIVALPVHKLLSDIK